jgi:phenylalanyl-tRNA synthetase alpha chain
LLYRPPARHRAAWRPRPLIARLGIRPGQRNVLVAITLRALDRTLTHAECNELRDDIDRVLHRGQVWHWAIKASGER